MGGPADAMGGSMAMDKLRAEKRSILDALKGDFADLDTKVATSDKMKIGSHLESLREIERRLSSDGPKMIGRRASARRGHRPRPHRQLPGDHRRS